MAGGYLTKFFENISVSGIFCTIAINSSQFSKNSNKFLEGMYKSEAIKSPNFYCNFNSPSRISYSVITGLHFSSFD